MLFSSTWCLNLSNPCNAFIRPCAKQVWSPVRAALGCGRRIKPGTAHHLNRAAVRPGTLRAVAAPRPLADGRGPHRRRARPYAAAWNEAVPLENARPRGVVLMACPRRHIVVLSCMGPIRASLANLRMLSRPTGVYWDSWTAAHNHGPGPCGSLELLAAAQAAALRGAGG